MILGDELMQLGPLGKILMKVSPGTTMRRKKAVHFLTIPKLLKLAAHLH